MEGIRKIMPHIWFNTEAAEASAFYQGIFEKSSVLGRRVLSGTPSGTVEQITLVLEDMPLMLLSAGPGFSINPSISFMVSSDSKEEVRRIWSRLMEGGQVLMPLDTYDFSPLFGFLADRFGVSWQIMLVQNGPVPAKIRPALMFVGKNCGHAEEAIRYYAEVFPKAKVHSVTKYGTAFPPNTEDMVNHALFALEGQHFSIMDSAYEHDFGFNEAVSLMVTCDNQEEIDHYWSTLSAVPEAEQCGWLKDRFGVSWQIVPRRMHEILEEAGEEALARVTQAFLSMKKFDIKALEKVYRQVGS